LLASFAELLDSTANGNYISIPDFSPLTTVPMVYRSSRIKLSAGQVFWREAGTRGNPVLLFLHGSWHDCSQWQEIMEPLSQHFHCFALDLLGYGNSVAIEPPTSIAIEVDCLEEFVTALQLSPVYPIGHSLGAWIAISYTLKYPDLVRGVVAISPEGFSLDHWRNHSKFTRSLLAYPWLLRLWLAGLKVLDSLSDGAKQLEKIQAYWQFFQKFPTTCTLLFGRSIKLVSSELVTHRLAGFRSPLLILQSDRDDHSVIAQSKSYAQSVRQSEYRQILDRSPQQIVMEVKNFVDRVQNKIDREEFELW
jgi:pimeloyl-ACP methyl ester carboxylesterase